ncbi:MAG: class F sortase [Dehalococcoidia bacterium]|nr:class F sortase [Dehalococcoidia bacterium]
MNVLRVLAVASFAAGVAIVALGLAARTGDSQPATPPPTRTEFVATPTPTPTAPLSPTEVAATATPTPPPYDGAVARLRIPSLEVDSAIEAIGLMANGQLAVPEDPLNTGWYEIEGYGKPGFDGNAVFAAHKDYWPRIQGPFWALGSIAPGADIQVAMDNGTEYRYVVIRIQVFDEATIPMGDVVWPGDRPAGEQWVTLITCDGTIQRLSSNVPGTYPDRLVVVAKRVE